VRSRVATVEAYVSEAPLERRNALALLRGLCLEELPGFEEAVRYGMPSYVRSGVVEVAFASQKAHISLYVLREDAFRANAERFSGLSMGKGCIRFRRPEQIDPQAVRLLLRAAAVDGGPLC
jgi:uncharacterized protein YdhG (YjbR/CyaY superfamily)